MATFKWQPMSDIWWILSLGLKSILTLVTCKKSYHFVIIFMPVKFFCLYVIYYCVLKSSEHNIYGIIFLWLSLMVFCYGNRRILNSPTQQFISFDAPFHYLDLTIFMLWISTSLSETLEAGTLWKYLHLFYMIFQVPELRC